MNKSDLILKEIPCRKIKINKKNNYLMVYDEACNLNMKEDINKL